MSEDPARDGGDEYSVDALRAELVALASTPGAGIHAVRVRERVDAYKRMTFVLGSLTFLESFDLIDTAISERRGEGRGGP